MRSEFSFRVTYRLTFVALIWNNKNSFAISTSIIDRYSELNGDEFKNKLNDYVEKEVIDFSLVKKYLSLFLVRTYRNLHEAGLMILGRDNK